jgi:hypothetical protein
MSLCPPGCLHCSGASLDDDEMPCGVCATPIDMGGDAFEVRLLAPDHAEPVCLPCLAQRREEDGREVRRCVREAAAAGLHLPTIEGEVEPWW